MCGTGARGVMGSEKAIAPRVPVPRASRDMKMNEDESGGEKVKGNIKSHMSHRNPTWLELITTESIATPPWMGCQSIAGLPPAVCPWWVLKDDVEKSFLFKETQ